MRNYTRTTKNLTYEVSSVEEHLENTLREKGFILGKPVEAPKNKEGIFECISEPMIKRVCFLGQREFPASKIDYSRWFPEEDWVGEASNEDFTNWVNDPSKYYEFLAIEVCSNYGAKDPARSDVNLRFDEGQMKLIEFDCDNDHVQLYLNLMKHQFDLNLSKKSLRSNRHRALSTLRKRGLTDLEILENLVKMAILNYKVTKPTNSQRR